MHHHHANGLVASPGYLWAGALRGPQLASILWPFLRGAEHILDQNMSTLPSVRMAGRRSHDIDLYMTSQVSNGPCIHPSKTASKAHVNLAQFGGSRPKQVYGTLGGFLRLLLSGLPQPGEPPQIRRAKNVSCASWSSRASHDFGSPRFFVRLDFGRWESRPDPKSSEPRVDSAWLFRSGSPQTNASTRPI